MKNADDIISKVKSPYSDEFIKNLIKIFVDAECDFQTTYDSINGASMEALQENDYVRTLENIIYNRGTRSNNGKLERKEDGKLHHVYTTKPVYDSNKYWMKLMSNPDDFADYENGDPEGTHLLYRIYLNAKGKDKLDCIMGYIEECHKKNLDYKIKFSRKDGRDDEIVILSTYEHLVENMSIVKNITKTMELGNVPMLIGKYENNIGIGEEHYNRLYSPTTARIALLGAAAIKYVCDHKDIAIEYCSDDEKKVIEKLSNGFKEKSEWGINLSEDYEKISSKEEATRNIYAIDDMGEGKIYISKLGKVVKKIYEHVQEDFLNEMTTNIRYIGNNVFGIAKDMLFSNATEDRIGKNKKIDIDS